MSSLTSLVQEQHHGDDAVRVYRSAFEDEPARFFVLEDFLVPAIAERLSRFLAREAQFAKEYGLYGIDDRPVSEEEWNAADEQERFFRFSKLFGTRREFQMSDNSLTYLRLRSTFQNNDDLRQFFEAATGIELAASGDFGSHSMGTGDFLKEHDDDNRNRRLALVLYLSPDWKPDYGGSLKIVDRDGNESTVEASYNSLVAFDTRAGTSHYVVPIADAAGTRKRLTIGGWYHDPE
ncbi:MAG: 2OG-Fe(II) oxygenase [Chloroflexota bacterium]|nr:2OG-Fe(II) oxygenase [Chloroflexota bacterium]